jgi:hypothetical protein
MIPYGGSTFMNEYNFNSNLKRYKYLFYSLNFVIFVVLAHVYINTLFFQVPFSEVLSELIISLSIIIILCSIYTYKGIFHKLYNPNNKMVINFTVGFLFGIFIGYFILYYSSHYVQPNRVLFTDYFTFRDYFHCIILALYIGLIICVGLSILTTLSKRIHENSKGIIATILQREYRIFEIIYLVIIFISFIILLNEFIQIIPTHKTKLYGMLFFSPIVFSLPVIVFTILEYVKRKSSLAKICLCIGILMFFWLWAFMDIGYLLLGP